MLWREVIAEMPECHGCVTEPARDGAAAIERYCPARADGRPFVPADLARVVQKVLRPGDAANSSGSRRA